MSAALEVVCGVDVDICPPNPDVVDKDGLVTMADLCSIVATGAQIILSLRAVWPMDHL